MRASNYFTAAETIVERFPAYYIVERAPTPRFGVMEIVDGDRLGLRHPKGFYKEFSPGSVVSYALECGNDPIAEVEDARRRGHELHWLNPVGASLTSHKRDPWKLVRIEIGQRVRFEGRTFEIAAAPNDNLRLVRVD